MNKNFLKAVKYATKRVESLGGILISIAHYDYDHINETLTYRFVYRLRGIMQEEFSSYKVKR